MQQGRKTLGNCMKIPEVFWYQRYPGAGSKRPCQNCQRCCLQGPGQIVSSTKGLPQQDARNILNSHQLLLYFSYCHTWCSLVYLDILKMKVVIYLTLNNRILLSRRTFKRITYIKLHICAISSRSSLISNRTLNIRHL